MNVNWCIHERVNERMEGRKEVNEMNERRNIYKYKKAVLSQRWPRDARYISRWMEGRKEVNEMNERRNERMNEVNEWIK